MVTHTELFRDGRIAEGDNPVAYLGHRMIKTLADAGFPVSRYARKLTACTVEVIAVPGGLRYERID